MQYIYIIQEKQNKDFNYYLKSNEYLKDYQEKDDLISLSFDDELLPDFIDFLNSLSNDLFWPFKAISLPFEASEKLLNPLVEYLKNLPQNTYTMGEILINQIKKNLPIDPVVKNYILSNVNKESVESALVFIETSSIYETSKKLYVHRNTLNYRIDTIYKKTGLNIRNMIDAFVFYILFS